MKSPFPGMDPYLERYWGDMHAKMIVYICGQISEQLPEDLAVHVEETVSVEVGEGDQSRWAYPDVQVVEEPSAPPYTRATASGVAVAEPRLVGLPSEAPPARHIEIIDMSSGDRVVTAIELLSRANKASKSGRRRYRQKQRNYLRGRVNLVEIDLLRSGSFVLAIPELAVPADCHAPYLICVRRANRPYLVELFPISLREPVPNVSVPLRPTDADIVLSLQPLIEQAYRIGRWDRIDYRQPPPRPPLNEDDARWADALLREKGLR